MGNMGHDHSSTVVFSGFPMHVEDYAQDIQSIMPKCIEKYGPEEWRLVVVTCELHGHLGIYAIIGAKMGVFAKERLESGHDELKIESFAGTRPPLSCLNDGLQASTGSTVGHGLFSLFPDTNRRPSAVFSSEELKYMISLKNDIHQKIEEDIRKAIKDNNGLSEGYWSDIRDLGINYWKSFNRNDIFEISRIR